MTAGNGNIAAVARRIGWKPIAAFALIAAGVVAIGITNYAHQRKQSRQQTEDALNAIADLKVTQLENWREERLSDARVLAANPFTVAALQSILGGNATPADESNARRWLEARMGHLSYSAALLLDATGGVRLAVGRAETTVEPVVTALMEEAVRCRKPVLSDFHMATPQVPYTHLDLVVPIYDLKEPGLPPAGFVLYHIDPELFLYPFIQSWPTPSLSGETLLTRRDGADVLFLNELRGKTNTALRLRVPLSNAALPTTQAILGRTGIVEGVDYAGTPVIAAVRRVPDTPWYLVAKVAAKEADAPLRARALFTGLFSAGAILAAGVLLAFLMKRRQAVSLLSQLDAERELAAIYENAPIIMLLVDGDRRVRKMNRFAEQFAGASPGGQVGMRAGEALRCLHALDDPKGCGFGPNCDRCVIRRVVMDTLTTGAQHSQVEATLAISAQGQAHTMTVLVSTSRLDSRGQPMALVAIQDITERKEAEERLKFQNLILTTQQDVAIDGILVVDENGKILSYNRQFIEMWRLPRELVEKGIDEPVLRFVTEQLLNPQQFFERVQYLYEHKRESSREDIVLGDGRTFDRYSAPMIGQDDCYYGRVWFFRDITESKRIQNALAERARLDAFGSEVGRALVEVAPLRDILQACCESAVIHLDGSFARVWVFNPEDQVLELQASAGIYTHIDGPHRRVNVGKFKIGRIAQTRLPHLTNQVIGDPQVADQEWARREGMVAFAGYPLLVEGRLIGVMAMFAQHPLGDLTLQAMAVVANSIAVGIVRKQAEDKIRKINESLESRVRDRTAQFEVSNKELETFAYSVSHDLRGPLRAIDGFSQSLLEDAKGKLDKQMMEDLVRVRKAAQRMSRLIDSLLTLSRTTRQEMTTEQVDLSLIAGDIASDIQKSDPSRSAEFAIMPGIVVNGDKQLLRLALRNLLENAWKFTRNCKQARIEFGVDLNDGKRVFFVRDDGVGFDMAYVGKLFGPFQRLHSEAEFEGTGIGLATVQRIIHRHGGKIWAEGEVGKGATFYFTI